MKTTKFLEHGNLELYGNDDLYSFVIRVLLTGSEYICSVHLTVSHTCLYYSASYY